MKQEAKTDEERMLDELIKYCWSTPLCKKNGRKCVLHRYCLGHSDFETKDIKSLYECMKKRMEEDRGTSEWQ